MTVSQTAKERVVAVVQARMTSTRLPGKVMADLCGVPLLQRLLQRLQQSKRLDACIVATTGNRQDDPVAALCQSLGVDVFRGSETDVLGRILSAAEQAGADVVVRITADCPLIDPEIVDDCIRLRAEAGVDFVSNVNVRTFPDGLDTEVMRIGALRKAAAEAHDPVLREHVTPYIRGIFPHLPSGNFSKADFKFRADFSHIRWTVDRQDDLDRVREIVAGLPDGFGWLDALSLATRQPRLLGLAKP